MKTKMKTTVRRLKQIKDKMKNKKAKIQLVFGL
jgi:hypothetical protein